MTKERFSHLLDTTPGIGVKATTSEGYEVLYFYEDFDGPATGIDRAMKQLYPQMNKGILKSLVFVEGKASREGVTA